MRYKRQVSAETRENTLLAFTMMTDGPNENDVSSASLALGCATEDKSDRGEKKK